LTQPSQEEVVSSYLPHALYRELTDLQDWKVEMALYNCSWEAWHFVDVEELG
jgi:hypothetical protein